MLQMLHFAIVSSECYRHVQTLYHTSEAETAPMFPTESSFHKDLPERQQHMKG